MIHRHTHAVIHTHSLVQVVDILGLTEVLVVTVEYFVSTADCRRPKVLVIAVACSVQVVDTPGLFDTTRDQQTMMQEIAKCFGIISPGPHAILLVVRIGVKFTEEENKAVQEVHRLFGPQLLRFLVIIFTHGDMLGNCDEPKREAALKKMLEEPPKTLRELVDVSCAQ